MLETKRSSLLKDLMLYLREVVSDFRVEMEDIMASDKQLAHEIEFDLRQFEKQQKEAEQAATAQLAAANAYGGDDIFRAPLPITKGAPGSTIKPPQTPTNLRTPDPQNFTVPKLLRSAIKEEEGAASVKKHVTFSVDVHEPSTATKTRPLHESTPRGKPAAALFDIDASPIAGQDENAPENASFSFGFKSPSAGSSSNATPVKPKVQSAANSASGTPWKIQSSPAIRPRSKRRAAHVNE